VTKLALTNRKKSRPLVETHVSEPRFTDSETINNENTANTS